MSAPRTRIGLREIRAMSPNETIFDGGTGSVPGFGARRRAGPHVSYFIMYRTRDGRQRRYTIGTHGAPWTPDAARAKAQQVLVAARIEGADPQADKKAKRSAATIAELCDMYMEDAEAGRLLTRRGIAKKPSTLVTDRSFIQAHIKPLLGRMKVPAVTREDVEHFMHQVAEGATRRRVKTSKKGGLSHVRGGKGVASRTVGLLGGIFTYAQRKRMITEHPVRGVRLANSSRRCGTTASGLAISAASPGRPSCSSQAKRPRPFAPGRRARIGTSEGGVAKCGTRPASGGPLPALEALNSVHSPRITPRFTSASGIQPSPTQDGRRGAAPLPSEVRS
ncbi:MAG: integrase arm-type DNA-binding domain-containing protein [Hyphomicrobiaceae bacterium]|nr:integrase arm-type DNA-binding domain-containing protein [Hyphomicrobiaceae bacterium]